MNYLCFGKKGQVALLSDAGGLGKTYVSETTSWISWVTVGMVSHVQKKKAAKVVSFSNLNY